MEHQLALLSPEKTILTYRLAGIGARIWAHLLDVVLIVAVILGALFVVSSFAMFGPDVGQISLGGLLIFVVAFPFLYFILFEGLWNGQTLGKKALRLRVRLADGTPVTFLAAIGRNLLRAADFMPIGTYFVGLLAIFTTPKSQRLGDLVANTVVVYERRPEPYFRTAPAPHSAGVHPFESQVGSLRGMTLDEYNALRRYCDRFPYLTAGAQTRLTEELWLPIAAKRGVEIPPNVHPLYLAEAVVMKYGREHGLL